MVDTGLAQCRSGPAAACLAPAGDTTVRGSLSCGMTMRGFGGAQVIAKLNEDLLRIGIADQVKRKQQAAHGPSGAPSYLLSQAVLIAARTPPPAASMPAWR